jgi:hypothetical protein
MNGISSLIKGTPREFSYLLSPDEDAMRPQQSAAQKRAFTRT